MCEKGDLNLCMFLCLMRVSISGVKLGLVFSVASGYVFSIRVVYYIVKGFLL